MLCLDCGEGSCTLGAACHKHVLALQSKTLRSPLCDVRHDYSAKELGTIGAARLCWQANTTSNACFSSSAVSIMQSHPLPSRDRMLCHLRCCRLLLWVAGSEHGRRGACTQHAHDL